MLIRPLDHYSVIYTKRKPSQIPSTEITKNKPELINIVDFIDRKRNRSDHKWLFTGTCSRLDKIQSTDKLYHYLGKLELALFYSVFRKCNDKL